MIDETNLFSLVYSNKKPISISIKMSMTDKTAGVHSYWVSLTQRAMPGKFQVFIFLAMLITPFIELL